MATCTWWKAVSAASRGTRSGAAAGRAAAGAHVARTGGLHLRSARVAQRRVQDPGFGRLASRDLAQLDELRLRLRLRPTLVHVRLPRTSTPLGLGLLLSLLEALDPQAG